MNLRRVERRLVAPFYLEMMGSNVSWLDKRTYGKLVRVGRKVTSTQVRALLRGGSLTIDARYEAAAGSPDRAGLLAHVTGAAPGRLHWRPVVMGAWLSLACGPDEITDDILFSLARCDGDLTAAPLCTAAVLIAGDAAVDAQVQPPSSGRARGGRSDVPRRCAGTPRRGSGEPARRTDEGALPTARRIRRTPSTRPSSLTAAAWFLLLLVVSTSEVTLASFALIPAWIESPAAGVYRSNSRLSSADSMYSSAFLR